MKIINLLKPNLLGKTATQLRIPGKESSSFGHSDEEGREMQELLEEMEELIEEMKIMELM